MAIKLPRTVRALNSRPELSLFAERFLVLLDTGDGVVYVPASGWDRAYLLWTFRNFRSLPQKVLSPKQQQLMASLYREASEYPSNYQGREFENAYVVGRIEEFNPSSLPALPVSRNARFAFTRTTLRVGAGALVAIIAVLAWHQLGAQPRSNSGSKPATAPEIGIQPSLSAQDRAQEKDKDVVVSDLGSTSVQPAANTVAVLPSPLPRAIASESIEAPSTLSPAVTSGTSIRLTNVRHPVTTASSVHEASTDQPRMRISGRPQKLVYPVCPETHARGNVSLEAVVGSDGAVNRVRILTGDRVLAAAAVHAVRQWRYEPFSGATEPLERETNITVSFISNEVVAVSFPNTISVSR